MRPKTLCAFLVTILACTSCGTHGPAAPGVMPDVAPDVQAGGEGGPLEFCEQVLWADIVVVGTVAVPEVSNSGKFYAFPLTVETVFTGAQHLAKNSSVLVARNAKQPEWKPYELVVGKRYMFFLFKSSVFMHLPIVGDEGPIAIGDDEKVTVEEEVLALGEAELKVKSIVTNPQKMCAEYVPLDSGPPPSDAATGPDPVWGDCNPCTYEVPVDAE